MGRRRKNGRDINGMILLDKSSDKTSNFELQQIRRLFNANKAGHTGSLDPIATGMLPICLGESTKFSQFLLDADKGYRVIGKLGEKTETSDREGAVIQEANVNISVDQLNATLHDFRGEIQQIPSMYSALKHQGQPLYKYARKGIEIERASRTVNIYSLTLESFDSPFFTLYVECSKGTYIRNLVEDIGDQLGCGAHVFELDRTYVGHFASENMITFEQLEIIKQNSGFEGLDQLLMPVDSAIRDWPQVIVSTEMTHYLLHGQAVRVADAPHQGLIRLISPNQQFLGVGEMNEDGLIAPKRLISTAEN